MTGTLLILAKAPRPGSSKTRLSPPFTLEEAASLAEAMLTDTLQAALDSSAARRVLVLNGGPGSWLPAGFELVPQVGATHAERITSAFDIAEGPAVLIGMDTPQVTPALIDRAFTELAKPGIDAVLGPALDGGWWLAGLRTPHPGAFAGVPMSTSTTVHAQRSRLEGLGLRLGEIEALCDVDDWSSASQVAAAAPDTAFARRFRQLAARPALLP